MKSCGIIGLRPDGFFFRNNEMHPLCKKIKVILSEHVQDVYCCGVRRFFVGGAQGTEMWSGEMLAAMKDLPEYSSIELICVMPFKGHDSGWGDAGKRRLSQILSACDGLKYISLSRDLKAAKSYRYIVENSNCLIAVYDVFRKPRCDIGRAVDNAKRRELKIASIHPETAAVSYFNWENEKPG